MVVDDNEIFGAKILIVDDQEANVMLLEQLLSDTGYMNVSTTIDPRTVCALHRKNRYDLILLDLQMPVMDGFEVMDGLRESKTDDYLPVLVLTAQPGHKIRALREGAKDFLSKPFDFLEVKIRIHNMLEVRMLYKKLENSNAILEQAVKDRTAELRASEELYKSLTELASDWYWEQDELMNFTKVSGPVLEMLGYRVIPAEEEKADAIRMEWNENERKKIKELIAMRKPFVDMIFTKQNSDATVNRFRVSGNPLFNARGQFAGYRGIGVEIITDS